MSNNYIERYVYDVTKRLNSKEREDVKKELLANIYDMLSENPTDKEVEKVLKSLGKPNEMANKYRKQERYLISPIYYDSYISTLKNVAIILATLGFVLGILNAIFIDPSSDIAELISIIFEKALGGLVEGVIVALIFVTGVYIVIERVNLNKNKSASADWSLEDLSKIPTSEGLEINKIEVIISTFFTVLFGIVLIFLLAKHNNYLGWFTHVDGKLELLVPIFNNTVRYFIIPFSIILILEVTNNLYVVKTGVKTKLSIVLKGARRVLMFIVVLILLSLKEVYNSGFNTQIVNQFGENGLKVFDYTIIFLQVVFSLGLLGAIFLSVLQYKKVHETLNK